MGTLISEKLLTLPSDQDATGRTLGQERNCRVDRSHPHGHSDQHKRQFL